MALSKASVDASGLAREARCESARWARRAAPARHPDLARYVTDQNRDQHPRVLDSHLPSGNRSFPRPHDVVDSHIVAQDLTAPAIVVAGDPQDLHSRVFQVGQRGERAKAASRNHRFPLEPEVEEIAIYDERSRFARQPAQERHERALDLRARDTQVRVGNDVARRVQHGSS